VAFKFFLQPTTIFLWLHSTIYIAWHGCIPLTGPLGISNPQGKNKCHCFDERFTERSDVIFREMTFYAEGIHLFSVNETYSPFENMEDLKPVLLPPCFRIKPGKLTDLLLVIFYLTFSLLHSF